MMRALLMVSLLPLAVFARDVRVTTEAELRAAVSGALPGDVIILANGTSALTSKVSCNRAATAALPIVLRGEQPPGATLESNTVIAIGMSAPCSSPPSSNESDSTRVPEAPSSPSCSRHNFAGAVQPVSFTAATSRHSLIARAPLEAS